MGLINGLYLYEVVLLVLGIVLFLVLITVFAALVIQRRPFSKLLSFFVLPIVMIGYPSIESVEFNDNMFRLAKTTHALERNPTDSALRKQVERNLEAVSGRLVVRNDTHLKLAQAELALGHRVEAERKIDKVLQAAPRQPAALKLKNQIELDRELAELTTRVEQNPADTVAKERLAGTVNRIGTMRIANPETIANVARAQAALGEEEEARTNVNRALTINPDLSRAIELRNRLEVP
jgi:tetratricopeptide (TPR) repeat protein